MRSSTDAVTARRARRLLAAVAGLCLIAFAAAPVPGAPSAGSDRGEVIVAAVLHGAATARAVPERLDLAHPSALKPHLSVSAVLPSSLLVALLLALCTPRRSATGTSRQAHLLASAGPGPPLHS